MHSDWPEPGRAPGGTLAALLARRGSLSPGEVVTLIAPLAQVLAAAHARGLGHGGITAETVEFTDDGRPLLTDLGRPTPPGGEPDPAADVAALAAVGWLALTGGATVVATTAPAALVDALRAAMTADPGERPDAGALADRVLRACAAQPVGLASAGAGPPRPEPRSRRRATVAGAAVLGLAMAVGVGVAWGRHGGATATALPGVATTPTTAPATARAPVPTVPVAPTAGREPAREVGVTSWRAVVAGLERRRARAFATGDVALLASLYDAGSRTGVRDIATLRQLARLGLHAHGFRPEVRQVSVRSADRHRAVLWVEDAMSRYAIVDPRGGVVVRGPPRPSRPFLLTLVARPDGWRIATLRPV